MDQSSSGSSKKGGITIIKNERDELISTRIVAG